MARHLVHDPWEHPFLEWVFWGLLGSAVSILAIGLLLGWMPLVVFGGIATGIGVWAGFLEPARITVARYREPLVPHPTTWLRIVFLSDLHAGLYKRAPYYARVAKQVQALAPEIVIVGGDLVDVEARAVQDLEAILRIPAPRGRFFILGNHDYLDDPAALRAVFRDAGWTSLETGPVIVEKEGSRCEFVAMADPQRSRPSALPARIPGVARVLVLHEPDNAFDVMEQDADLAMTGHTHGGQVRMPGVGALLIPQVLPKTFDRGRKMWRDTPLLIGQGIGESGVRARFLCPPQIVVIEVGIGESTTA